MNGKFLLDTNVVIRLFARDAAVERQMEANPNIFLSSFVLGELYYGAYRSELVERNCNKIAQFAVLVDILGCDDETAREYGRIKDELRRKGKLIPNNDIWIAGSARRHDLILVSDDRHFENVSNLRWEQW
jgi:tRNA(fMet)-specific endonuclease VapC